MTTLLVDWLGRGGIAQCTESWAIELDAAGIDVVVATRAGRELAATPLPTVTADGRGRLAAHRHLVAATVEAIRQRRPDTVVVQNFLIPSMEQAVHRAARAVGARLVFVVHDHQHHTRTSGTHLGLRRQVRRADVLLAHSRFVADRVAARFGRRPALMPQPVPVAMVRLPAPSTPVLPEPEGRRALHFGVLSRRSTKGTDIAVAVAEGGVPGWEFAFLGVQAPDVPGARSVDRFLDADEMVDAVRSSTASLLPYRMASQSGAVVLAQALGSVPIACRVGGLGEQIDHGRTGLLLEPSATPARWARSLQDLDDGGAAELAAAAHRSVWAQHERFAVEAARVVAP